MSKYHPIDVRHPANRQYRDRNFLLDPPSADAERILAGEQVRSPSRPRTIRERAVEAGRNASAVAPWGAQDTPAPAVPQRRSGGFLRLVRLLIILGAVGWVVSNETGLLDDALMQLRIWAYELGIRI